MIDFGPFIIEKGLKGFKKGPHTYTTTHTFKGDLNGTF
jgi:hypothetical protein